MTNDNPLVPFVPPRLPAPRPEEMPSVPPASRFTRRRYPTARSLDLDMILPEHRPAARRAYEEGRGRRFANCGRASDTMLELVAANLTALLARGIFEPALLQGLLCPPFNNHRHTELEIEFLLCCSRRKRFRRYGARLPRPAPFRAYRGVWGDPFHQRRLGWAWTASLDVAQRYAGTRPTSAVYVAELPVHEVWGYFPRLYGRTFLACTFHGRKLSREELPFLAPAGRDASAASRASQEK